MAICQNQKKRMADATPAVDGRWMGIMPMRDPKRVPFSDGFHQRVVGPDDTAIGFHISLRLSDSRPIAPTVSDRRAVVRAVVSQGAHRGLIGFGCADNHLHAVLATQREVAGAFGRYVASQLRWMLHLAVPFEPMRIRALRSQSHALNAFYYCLRQDSHHELFLDPGLEGTCAQDLLGLRVVDPGLFARVRTCLPRIQYDRIAALFPPGSLEGASDYVIDFVDDLQALPSAAAAAVALSNLKTREPLAVRARRAAVHLFAGRVPNDDLAKTLNIGVRAIQLHRRAPHERHIIVAIRRQLLLARVLRQMPQPHCLSGSSPGG